MSNLFNMIKRHEGLKLTAYKDTEGILTIGYGRNLEGRGISIQEAEMMLDNDISDCMAQLRVNLPYFDVLDSVRQDVLIDMCFNLGFDGLLKFKLTLTHIQHGDYAMAAEAMMDSRWAKQVGDRAVELSKMMKTGKYQDLP